MNMMKRPIFWAVLPLLAICAATLARAQGAAVTALGSAPASGQVSCGNSPTLLYATTASGGTQPHGRLSVTFQNQSTTPVYIAPRADISTSNAGVLLGTQYLSATFDRSNGDVSWYCITASGSAAVGWTEK